jgi:hypothetical protein
MRDIECRRVGGPLTCDWRGRKRYKRLQQEFGIGVGTISLLDLVTSEGTRTF